MLFLPFHQNEFQTKEAANKITEIVYKDVSKMEKRSFSIRVYPIFVYNFNEFSEFSETSVHT